MNMHDRVAVVTGASRGLGKAIALALGRQGFSLALADIADLRDTVSELEGGGTIVMSAKADVSRDGDVVRFASEVMRRFGRVDALVNNAGISLLLPAEETPTSAWQKVIDVNLTGPFLMCREFGVAMLSVGSGSIVNVSSIAGVRGVSHRAAYSASKHGLVGLTSTLAAEWGGRGVRVNAVCPAWIKTEMDVEDQASGGYNDADIIEEVPLARFATVEDVASTVSFLLDPTMSGYINGVCLPVDGGWSTDASWTSLRLRTREHRTH